MLFADPTLLVISLSIVMLGALIQGTLGMGFGQIGAAGLIWTLPELLPGIVILMAMLVGGFGAWRERQGIDYSQLSYSLLGRVAGTLLAVPLLFWVSGNSQDFALLFAILILIGTGCSLWRISPPMGKPSLLGGGLVSGLMGTITSVGAPPMGIVYQNEPAARARPTLNLFFALGSVPSLLALAYSGHLHTGHAQTAAVLFPGYLLGVWLSRHLHAHVDARFRFAVIGFTALSALALIVRALI